MEALTIFLIALVGGLIPLFVRWSDRHLHTALALATGIFLGAVFLHLLPSVAHVSVNQGAHAQTTPLDPAHAAGDGHDHAGHEGHDHADDDGHDHGPAEDGVLEELPGHVHGDPLPWFFVMIGVLAVYLIEALILPAHDHDHSHGHSHPPLGDDSSADPTHLHSDLSRHRSVGYAALVGLGIHALTAGISLAAAGETHALGAALFVAICAHKGFEGFSLATVFLLAEMKRSRIIALLVGFALITPLGMFLGHNLVDLIGQRGIGIAAALAAGTFLYVSLCELLPEVFHRREAVLPRGGLLIVGILLMAWFEGAGA